MKPDEAAGIAKASANVMRHYNVQATQKAIDYAALVSVLAQSYGIRLAATAMRTRTKPRAPNMAQGGVPPTPRPAPSPIDLAAAGTRGPDPIADPSLIH